MATIFTVNNSIRLEYRKRGKVIRENLKLTPTPEDWKKANELKKQAELLYETENGNSAFKKLLKKEIESSSLALSEAIERYQNHLTLTSETHQKNFVYAMGKFLHVVDNDINIDKITSSDVVRYLKLLKDSVSNGTVRTYYTYIRLFFNYLCKEDFLDKSPCRNVKNPAEEEKEIITFDENMKDQIFEAAKIKDPQFYLALKFLILTGMRPNDAVIMKVKNFDFEENELKFRISKTKNIISFPIYPKLEKFLNEELREVFEKDSETLLFENLTVDTLGQKFRRLKKGLGLPNNYSLNLKSYRKTFASEMLKLGVRLEYVSYMLGHKKLQTTKKYYTKINPSSIRDEIMKAGRVHREDAD